MKFAIMGRILRPEYGGFGVQTVLNGLLAGMASISHPHEILLLVDPAQLAHITPLMQRYRLVPVPPDTATTGKLWWDHLAVGQVCKQHGVDALYAPAHVRPIYAPCPVVVLIHDMMYHLFPHHWTWSDQLYFRVAVSTLTPHSAAIAAVSHSTRDDIFKFVSVPPERVEVIYPGVPDGFGVVPVADTSDLRTRYQLARPFVLYVGGFHPRKNMTGMLDAFETIASQIDHDLVLIGPAAWKNPAIAQRIQQSHAADRIRFVGFVPREDLPLFYNCSDLFVFPSFYEGFGLPVLEALACGCPIITTNVSSLPEVAGDAALLVEPGDTQALSDAMSRVLLDSNLRDRLRQRAVQQAQRFSWETAAAKTLALLEHVVRHN